MTHHNTPRPLILVISAFIFFTLCLSSAGFAQATPQTVAIIPFKMISAENLPHIQAGTAQMLRSRLLWKNNINVVHPNIVKNHLESMQATDPNARIKKVAELTNSDYILTGNIIQFSNAFSIDAKLYDIKNKQYLAFFEQTRTIDELIPKINIMAAKINKKVFKRETIVFESMVKKQKQQAEEWRRQNPEKLLPNLPQGEPEEKTPIWKIWKYL